jgi:hypothetical protein
MQSAFLDQGKVIRPMTFTFEQRAHLAELRAERDPDGVMPSDEALEGVVAHVKHVRGQGDLAIAQRVTVLLTEATTLAGEISDTDLLINVGGMFRTSERHLKEKWVTRLVHQSLTDDGVTDAELENMDDDGRHQMVQDAMRSALLREMAKRKISVDQIRGVMGGRFDPETIDAFIEDLESGDPDHA